jgi:hypothetical protein
VDPGEVRQISLGTTVNSGFSEVVTARYLEDFSGTQGQGGWYHGYYATSGSSESFTQLPFFNGDNLQESATIPPLRGCGATAAYRAARSPGPSCVWVRPLLPEARGSALAAGIDCRFDR